MIAAAIVRYIMNTSMFPLRKMSAIEGNSDTAPPIISCLEKPL